MTGMLVFYQHHFLQAIEGERQTVDALLSYAPIDQRSYAEWSMEFKSAAVVGKWLFLLYSGSSCFEPSGLSEAGALALMEAFLIGVPEAERLGNWFFKPFLPWWCGTEHQRWLDRNWPRHRPAPSSATADASTP